MKLSSTIKTLGVIALALTLGVGVGVAAAQENGRQIPRPEKTDMKARAEQNREVRGNALEQRAELRNEGKAKMASSTQIFKKDMRPEIKKRMEAKQFEMRKAALVRELSKALEHLNDIVVRIESRITKAEGAGRTMTEPKALLVTAKAKIEVAKTAVEALKATGTSTPSTGTATTTEVDLTKPRQIGDTAIKAVKEARDSLQKVVVSIAHNMGLKTGQNATSTPPRGQKPPKTGTSTPPTGTTTTPPTATTTSN